MAKGLNIYTGVERTPPSLAWLVAKRMHTAGEIQRLEKLLANAPAQIAALNEKLASLDEVIGMHETPIDPATLPPRQKRVRKVQLPFGALKKTILRVLRTNAGQPLPTNRFVQAIVVEYEVPVDKEVMRALRRMMISALNNEVRHGRLIPLHPKVTHQEGTWMSASDAEL